MHPEKIPDFLKNSKWGKPTDEKRTIDYTSHVINNIERLGIDVLVPIGGDDTLSFAVRLHKEGVPIVAIPKTMDNDVYGTDYCIGFSTAVTRSVDFITSIRSTAGSHERIAVVELFGRNSGETSLISAYLAFVDRAIISEVPFDADKLAKFLLDDKRNNPSHYAIMTISEGATFEGGNVVESGEFDMFGHRKLGGIGLVLAEVIKDRTGEDVLYQQLAYLMRSGVPDSLDRMVATCYGHLAVQLIKNEKTGRMVALSDGRYTSVPVEIVTADKKRIDVNKFYDARNYRPKIKQYIGMPMFLR
jgi:6-phosphofructokinase 1